MLVSQLFLLIAIFVLCLFLAFEDIRSAFIFFLLVSPLLHKEVFSLVRWDVLPVRLVLLAILLASTIKFLIWIRKKKDWPAVYSFIKDPIFIFLMLLFLVRLVSLIGSKNLGASSLLLTFFATIVFLYVLMSYLARRYGAAFLLSNIKFYVFVAFGTAIVGVIQIILDIKFGIIFGALWRIPGKLSRVGSVFWDVNHYGGYLASIIPITAGLGFSSRSKLARYVYFFISIFLTFVLVLTNSRSAWIGFSVSVLVALVSYLLRRFGRKSILYLLLTCVLMLIPLYVSYKDKDSVVREKINGYLHYRGDSFASHLLLLNGAFQIFEKYPVLGGGYGSFFEHFKETQVASVYYGRDPAALSVRVPAHSIWGEVISETGFIGLFVFIVLSILSVTTVFLAAKNAKSSGEFTLFSCMAGSLVGYLVSGIFYSYNAEFFWIVFFFSVIYSKAVLGDTYSFANVLSYFFGRKFLHLPVLLVISAFVLFANLGSNHLIPWDEAIYARVSKNMLQSGEYLTLTWDGDKQWFEKPPLYMWISSAVMGIYGVEDLSVKFPSAFFGLLAVIFTFLLASKMFGNRVGFMSAAVLVSTVHFLHYARIGMLDVTLTFFMVAAVYFYYTGLTHFRTRSLNYFIAGLLIGLAVMTKGVIGFLIFPALLAYELLIEKRLDKRLALMFIGICLSGLPWHVHQYITHGQKFYDTYIGYHVLKRATTDLEDKTQPWYWYLIVMKVSMRLWFGAILGFSFFFTASLVKKFSLSKEQLYSNRFTSRPVYLLLTVSVILLVLLSLSTSKLTWYLIPIYPYLSILSGLAIIFMLDHLSKVKYLSFLSLETFGVLTIVSLGLFYFFFVRSMVYVEDYTGSKARIVALKDSVFGVEPTLYYDRIERPLAMYYSDGPVVETDFNPLVERFDNVDFDETVIFITSEGRFEKLLARYPNVYSAGKDSGFVLGRLRSEEEVVKQRISDVENRIDWILEEGPKGNSEAQKAAPELPALRKTLSCLDRYLRLAEETQEKPSFTCF